MSDTPTTETTEQSENQLRQHRLDKLDRIRARGDEPYKFRLGAKPRSLFVVEATTGGG